MFQLYFQAYNSTFRTKRYTSGRQHGPSLKRLSSNESNKSNNSDKLNIKSDNSQANGFIENTTSSLRKVQLVLPRLREAKENKEKQNTFLLVELSNDSSVGNESPNLSSRL